VTALQDWLNYRPVDHNAIRDMVCRPFRAVLSTPVPRKRVEFTSMGPGVERC
jgi:hypothetical protein